jgi:hypothetical protein
MMNRNRNLFDNQEDNDDLIFVESASNNDFVNCFELINIQNEISQNIIPDECNKCIGRQKFDSADYMMKKEKERIN